ncbi:SusC/RagA family TonB-linked outer membrane protein [Pedobacter sp. PLR]|uniref:SusC/RagA family TonB-linked outer membrane protein n=1 Tax=Pedobacter sp. PLR TaxID=2994465 RepID=UPI002245AF88|nr:SusC/RagA family TonB-linked outer membrane protein [Pedobacter sp. PLR]MCX2454258.1 SusC/RagA family TonB-linked outer membrane protein [Pedobacter sp. PLR]
MRIQLVFLIVFAAMLQVSASSYAQKININQTNISLEKALKLIRQQSGYDFLFDAKVIQKASTFNINIKNADINEALKQCLKGQNLTYSLEEHTVLIKEKSFFESLKENLDYQLNANDITGYVFIEKTSTPLIGATVMVKRTKKAVYTDIRGVFTIKDVLPTDTLVCSYIGYVNKYVAVKNNMGIFVYLTETTNALDAIVVQGYGKTTQRLATGNIVRVTASDIGKQLLDNPIMALQGAVPGLEITSLDSRDAGLKKIELRGRKSINANLSSEPLYIIDGVPLTILSPVSNALGAGTQSAISTGLNGNSPLYNINPGDIESIDVLKDADATAIYGSRGGNGVILITTKKGKAGKTTFAINGQQGVKMIIKKWDLLNTEQYLDMRRQAFKNDGTTPTILTAPELLKYDQNRYTDWQEMGYGNLGKWTNFDANLSGGDAQTTFRLSSGLNRTKDISTYSGLNQRISANTSLSHNSLDQRFKIEFMASYTSSEDNSISVGDIAIAPTNAPDIFDVKGGFNFKEWANEMDAFTSLKRPKKNTNDYLNSSISIGYSFFNNFNFKVNFGYNSNNSDLRNILPLASFNIALSPDSKATIITSNMSAKNFLVEPQANYNTFIGKGKLALLLGGTFQNNSTNSRILTASGFASDEQLTSINAATTYVNKESVLAYKYAGVFARINYNWENKYILNLNARRDGSSRFGPDNRYGNFGSIGAAWIVSEEKWVQKYLPKAISLIKLRGSYGILGSDAVGDYKYLTQYGNDYLGVKLWPYDGVNALVPQIQPNSDFRWQQNKKTELGLSLAFFKDVVNIDFAWYSDYTNNQLLEFPSPIYTGFNNIVMNSPAEVENKGIEFMLTAQIINTKNFSWNTSFNFSKNDNKLVGYENFEESPYYSYYKIGQSLNNSYVFKSLGVDPNTGLYTYYDFDGDGKVSYLGNVPAGTLGDDRGVAINTSPEFFGGMTQSFRFKNISLSTQFYYSKIKGKFGTQPLGSRNITKYGYENTWRQPGDQALYAKFTNLSTPDNGYYGSSDAYLVDADFIKLKNIQLAYSLPGNALKFLGISALSVNVTGQNIFVITKYKGMDPETQQSGGMPPTRVFTMGLNCTF